MESEGKVEVECKVELEVELERIVVVLEQEVIGRGEGGEGSVARSAVKQRREERRWREEERREKVAAMGEGEEEPLL